MQVYDRRSTPAEEPLPAKVAARFADFDAVMSTVKAELANDRFSAAFGKFREAVNLSRGFPVLEEQVAKLAAAQAEQWLPQSWRLAKALVLEAAEVNPQPAMPHELWERIQACEQEESLRVGLNGVDAASSNGMTLLALQRLTTLGSQYTGDPRVEAHLKAVQALQEAQREGERRQQADKEAKAAAANQLLARAMWASAREFEKDGLYLEALERLASLQEIDPLYPGLEEAMARGKALKDGVASADSPQPAATPGNELKLSKRGPGLKAAVLLFAGLSLAMAALLVGTHLAKSPTKPAVVRGVPFNTAARSPENTPPETPVSPPAMVTASPKAPPATRVIAAVVETGSAASASQTRTSKPQVLEISRSKTDLEQLPPPPENAAKNVLPAVELPPETSTSAADARQLPFALADTAREDNEAWATVNPSDPDAVASYLNRFPQGVNRPLAVNALAEIRRAEAAKRQSAELLDVVRRYAAAWSARDVDSILSLQRSLDRRTVKAQLAPLRSLVMNISPVAEPSIDREQASLRCRRQVSEVFLDGVKKDSLEQTVTFLLIKRDGAWTIEGTRQ